MRGPRRRTLRSAWTPLAASTRIDNIGNIDNTINICNRRSMKPIADQ